MDLTSPKNQETKKSKLPTIRASLEKVMEIYQVKTKHKYFYNIKYTVMFQLNTSTPPPTLLRNSSLRSIA